jgi:hypothetical protein
MLDGKHLSQPDPRSIDPALDRAEGHPAHLGGLLVRQALGPNQEQSLTLIDGICASALRKSSKSRRAPCSGGAESLAA